MYYTVTTTCSSNSFATDLAQKIVNERIAACANVVAGVNSLYIWNERMETSHEVIIIFKTNELSVSKLMARIKELHHYETPMICAHKIEKIEPNYALWIDDSIRV